MSKETLFIAKSCSIPLRPFNTGKIRTSSLTSSTI